MVQNVSVIGLGKLGASMLAVSMSSAWTSTAKPWTQSTPGAHPCRKPAWAR